MTKIQDYAATQLKLAQPMKNVSKLTKRLKVLGASHPHCQFLCSLR